MNIIKYDTYFSPIITLDNTEITLDNTEITLDMLSQQISGYRMDVLPRKYDTQISLKIRDMYKNTTETMIPECVIDNGILKINLDGFTPVEDKEYEIYVLNDDGVLWYGLAMYTVKNIQNYQVNNSNENNLKF